MGASLSHTCYHCNWQSSQTRHVEFDVEPSLVSRMAYRIAREQRVVPPLNCWAPSVRYFAWERVRLCPWCYCRRRRVHEVDKWRRAKHDPTERCMLCSCAEPGIVACKRGSCVCHDPGGDRGHFRFQPFK